MTGKIISTVAFWILASPCFGDDCSSIANDAERLKCFDTTTNEPGAPTGKYARFVATAKETLAARLNDPASVKWREVYPVGDAASPKGICGELMARNRFGGYTGWRRFIGVMQPSPDLFVDTGDDVSAMFIAAAYSGASNTPAPASIVGFCMGRAPE